MGSSEKFLTSEQVQKLPMTVVRLENIMDDLTAWLKRIQKEGVKTCDFDNCPENSSLGDETTEESEAESDRGSHYALSSIRKYRRTCSKLFQQFSNSESEGEDDLPQLVPVNDLTEAMTNLDMEINGPVSPEPVVVHVTKKSRLAVPDHPLVGNKESKIRLESETGKCIQDTEPEDPYDRFWKIESLVAKPDFLEALKLRPRPLFGEDIKKDPETYSVHKLAPVHIKNECDDKATPESFDEVVVQTKIAESIENLWQDLTEIMKADGIEKSLPYKDIWPHLLHVWDPIKNILPDEEARLCFDALLLQDELLPSLVLTEVDLPIKSNNCHIYSSNQDSSTAVTSDAAGIENPTLFVEDNNDPPPASDNPAIVITVSLENPQKSGEPRLSAQQLPENEQETLSWKAVRKTLQRELKQVDRYSEPDRWVKLLKELNKLEVLRQDENNSMMGVPALMKTR